MSELKVAQKLMLMSIFFLLPDSVMLFLLISDLNRNIQFAELEREGNAYLRPLVHLSNLLPLYESACQRKDNASIARFSKDISGEFSELTRLDQIHGANLKLTTEAMKAGGQAVVLAGQVFEKWNQIACRPATGEDAVRSDLCKQLTDNLSEMITHTGNLSNLILDPDLDSYYLMDATLMSLPRAMRNLEQTICDGERVLGRESNAVDRLIIHSEMLRENAVEHVSVSINTAMHEDAKNLDRASALQRQLPVSLAAYTGALNRFIDRAANVNRNSQSRDGELTPFVTSGQDAQKAAAELWELSSKRLEELLQRRIEGFKVHRLIALAITASAALAALFLVRVINRSINRPLRMQADALRLANTALTREVNQKLEAQQQLLAASRRAGMAEIAEGVLHNVGNVLNSVNTSATMIRENLSRSEVPTLNQAALLVQEHKSDSTGFWVDNPRGKLLPDLLSCLAETLEADRQQISEEVTHLCKNVNHIKHIIHSQQTFAKGTPNLEETNLVETIEDALRIVGLDPKGQKIEIVKQYATCPTTMLDKHKLLQALVNVIGNARKAVAGNPCVDQRITLKLESTESESGLMARISVIDSGVGISPENMQKIFQHGFTTRKDGHGFGLHASANDIHKMGGSVKVTSPGPGLGATFMLEIPLSRLPLVEVGPL